VKTRIAVVALIAFAGVGTVAGQELSDVYTNLQAAVAKKDVDSVAKLSADVSKMAKPIIASPQPAAAGEVDAWKQRVEYAKEVDSYASYALSATAMGAADPAKTVELVDELIAQDPKSKYVDTCAGVYLEAARKTGGAAKQMDGAAKIVAGRPDNTEALLILAAGNSSSPYRLLSYGNRLVAAARKPKPEGTADAEWERLKSIALGRGLYFAGVANAQKTAWADCDRDLKEALPYIGKEPALVGTAYFYLGLSNYQLGRLMNDRARMLTAQKYSEQSAAMAGPNQQAAARNAAAIKGELAGPAKR